MTTTSFPRFSCLVLRRGRRNRQNAATVSTCCLVVKHHPKKTLKGKTVCTGATDTHNPEGSVLKGIDFIVVGFPPPQSLGDAGKLTKTFTAHIPLSLCYKAQLKFRGNFDLPESSMCIYIFQLQILGILLRSIFSTEDPPLKWGMNCCGRALHMVWPPNQRKVPVVSRGKLRNT